MTEDTPKSALPQIPEPNMPKQIPHDAMLQFFSFAHLPPHLQEISKVFHDVAKWMLVTLPYNPERSAGLRKLLEAKDCAVRANLFKT